MGPEMNARDLIPLVWEQVRAVPRIESIPALESYLALDSSIWHSVWDWDCRSM